MLEKVKALLFGERQSDEIRAIAKEIDGKGVEGFFSHDEGELLYYLAAGCPKNGTIVEIGSWKGRSTCWMGRASERYSEAKIYASDPHVGSPEHQKDGPINTFDQFKLNLEKMRVTEKVTPIVKFSYDAVVDVEEPIDLLFIDGAHEYEAVKKDFDLWFPKLKTGGVIAFHDSVGKGWPGVHQLMEEEIFDSVNFKDIGFVGTITFATKVEANDAVERVKNRFTHVVKKMHEVRRSVPQPYRVIEHHLVKRRIQRGWVRRIRRQIEENCS